MSRPQLGLASHLTGCVTVGTVPSISSPGCPPLAPRSELRLEWKVQTDVEVRRARKMAQLAQVKEPEPASWSGLICELQAKERPCLK